MSRKHVKNWLIPVIVILGLSCRVSGFMTDNNSGKDTRLFELSLEELMKVEVVSASRQAQSLEKTGIPVSVVTSEDIHYSGLTNLYEILAFTPSMDMLRVDRNRYALGVRGLHDTWSDRTLTLVDGRSADNAGFGGSEFLRLPIFMEDIKQIEVLRGPSGSVWGANAFNGAINIITKKPEQCQGILTSGTVNSFGETYNHIRWGSKNKNWSWRISGGYNDTRTTSDVLDKTFYTALVPGGFETRDFRRASLFDIEVVDYASDESTLSMGLGHSSTQMGDFGFLMSFPQKDGFMETTRAFAKLETDYDQDTRSSLQWYGNFYNTKWPALIKCSSMENQIEGQLDFSLIPDHHDSVGASARITRFNQDIMGPEDFTFTDDPYKEQRVNAFFVDRWDIGDKLRIESQLSGEHYSRIQSDWAARVSAIYALDTSQNVSVSAAKSYRTPLAAIHSLRATRLFGFLNVSPDENLRNEETYSLEAGYNAKLNPTTTFRINAYLQEYSEMIGYESSAPLQYRPVNFAKTKAYGIEPELSIQQDNYRLSLWYACNRFFLLGDDLTSPTANQEVRAYLPAKHKAGATFRLSLPQNTTLNLNYKISSLTDGSHGPMGGADVPSFQRLDLAIAKEFKMDKTKGEILIGVSDLFDQTDILTADSGTGPQDYGHQTPGRMFFARLQLLF